MAFFSVQMFLAERAKGLLTDSGMVFVRRLSGANTVHYILMRFFAVSSNEELCAVDYEVVGNNFWSHGSRECTFAQKCAAVHAVTQSDGECAEVFYLVLED